MRGIDLFCGCGGLSSGFAQEGFEILAGVDIYPPALATFAYNFPDAKVLNIDLSKPEPQKLRSTLKLLRGELDCLYGGPPCQGFSKNVPAAQRWLDDPRNHLMRVFLSFVEEFLPKTLLIENVAEIVNAYDQEVSQAILTRLRELGYNADVKALNASHYGVPQIRRRAFFLASRVGCLRFPLPTHATNARESVARPASLFDDQAALPVTVSDAISDLPPVEAGSGVSPCAYAAPPLTTYQRLIRNGDDVVHDHIARALTPVQMERIKALGEGEGIKHLPDHLRPRSGYSGAYARLFPNEPARTITRWVFHPGSGRFVHPYEHRVITIREAARLQSFPDYFAFTGTYIQKSHQVGEAAPPLLARALARSLGASLSS